MTNRSELEQALDRYLAEGGEQVPDRVVDAALDQIDHTSQRLALRVRWRYRAMPTFLKPALAAVAVIALMGVGGIFLTRGPAVGTPPVTTPPPSTPVSAAPSGSPSCFLAARCRPSSSVPIDTSDWVLFTSERYGYRLALPPTWSATPATQAWGFETDHTMSALCCMHEGSDQFAEVNPYTISSDVSHGGYPIWLRAFAVDVPASPSEDGWMADYYASRPDMAPGYCEYADTEQRPISVDGHPGTMIVGDAECGDSAFVFNDGRVHVFWLEAYDRPAQMAEWRTLKTDLLEAFLGTIDFRP